MFSGESGLVYKAYINTAIGKELVAVKTGKGIHHNIAVHNTICISCEFPYLCLYSFVLNKGLGNVGKRGVYNAVF